MLAATRSRKGHGRDGLRRHWLQTLGAPHLSDLRAPRLHVATRDHHAAFAATSQASTNAHADNAKSRSLLVKPGNKVKHAHSGAATAGPRDNHVMAGM